MQIKYCFSLILLFIIWGSCIKVNYKLFEMDQSRKDITLHVRDNADVEYNVRGTWLKEKDKISLSVENLPKGISYTVKSNTFSDRNGMENFEIILNFSTNNAPGGTYFVRVVATGTEGGRAERILKITVSPYSIYDLMKMKKAYDSVYNNDATLDFYLHYSLSVSEDIDNKPTGIIFTDLGLLLNAAGNTFPDVYATLDTLSGKITLFKNDMITRKLTSGEGYIHGIGSDQYVEINYVTTNVTGNTQQNGKVTLRQH